MNLVFVVGIVQHAVEIDLVDLGDGAYIARNSRVDFLVILALNLEQVPDLERFPRITDEELAVLGDGALLYAKDTHLADERIDGDLEHVGECVFGWIGLDGHGFTIVTVTAYVWRRISFTRIRHQTRDDLQQLFDSRVTFA